MISLFKYYPAAVFDIYLALLGAFIAYSSFDSTKVVLGLTAVVVAVLNLVRDSKKLFEVLENVD